MGFSGSTVVNMVTRSGSNQFHGSGWEFLRNNILTANNWFSNANGESLAARRYNQFGATVGGPIRKDKTFFFLQYAGLRQRLGEPDIEAVPTADERNGVVTIAGPNGQADALQVPLNPIAQNILGRYPLPNQPNGVFGPNTFNYMFSQPTNDDQFSARLDHHR